ncbi:Arm DNA-binding domain-containing protein [Xanthomonas cannabis]|uniref:Arm DNA-binding domain-containing protein n=1 Tax=Xanthomonas cannabis TaxID=1885674 RepID=UPI0033A86C4F
MRDATVPGLVLRVSATGARCWAIVWGRGQERTFGDYPALPLEAARERARKLAGEIAAHGAPLAVIEAARPKPATLGSFLLSHHRWRSPAPGFESQPIRHTLKLRMLRKSMACGFPAIGGEGRATGRRAHPRPQGAAGSARA